MLNDFLNKHRLRIENQWSILLARRYRIAGQYRRIYFHHIRKAGGTSLCHTFLSLGRHSGQTVYERINASKHKRIISGNKVFVGYHKRLIEEGHYFFAFSHRPAHELRIPEQTFTFTCLRDPAARVLSHYNMLMHFKKNNIAHACMQEEGPWLGRCFQDFIHNIPREHLLRQLYMFSAEFNINEAEDRIRHLGQCLYLDNFSTDIAALSHRLQLPLSPLRVRVTPDKFMPKPTEMVLLKDHLQPEYQLLNLLSLGNAR